MDEIRSEYPDGEVTELDGVSVDYDDWHFNVRPSNTEPLLRLNLESLVSRAHAAEARRSAGADSGGYHGVEALRALRDAYLKCPKCGTRRKLGGPAPLLGNAELVPPAMKMLQRRRRPKVTALAAQEDMEGLVSAAGFQDVSRNSEGEMVDHGAEVRAQAVLALGELGQEAGNGSLTEALRDPSDDVRSAAVRVLFQRGEVAPLAHALSWLPADTGNSRSLALRALLELKKPGTAQLVIRALVWAPGDHPLPDLDVALVHTLVQADTSADVANEAVHELLTALSEDRAEVVARAEELLQRLAPASVPGLIAELEGGGSPERAAALLGRIADNRALQPLIDALGHRELSVRLHAASALGQLRQPAAVEPLLRATRDNSRDVRAEAGRALDSLGTAAVVIGMSTMVRPLIAEAVASAVDQHGLADREEPAPVEPPARQLGVGGFRSALEEARTAAEQSR